MLKSQPRPSRRAYLVAKRGLDISLSLAFGAAVLAIFPVVAMLITLDSPGLPVYRQVRLGQGGRPFTIYKFRSMVTDAEVGGQAVWASVGDPRVTRVGRLLRCTRIDELPQVWNVLRGDMTFVGPRPERPTLTDELERSCPGFRGRLAVKPGLTGLAQVSYSYTSSVGDAAIKLTYDLEYIRRASLALDVVILARTVLVVLGRRGR